jgi:hypothetical protein
LIKPSANWTNYRDESGIITVYYDGPDPPTKPKEKLAAPLTALASSKLIVQLLTVKPKYVSAQHGFQIAFWINFNTHNNITS